jgi:hypothetical protein
VEASTRAATVGEIAMPSESTELHSRLLRCSLCIDESRAYWARVDPCAPRASSAEAFSASWFGRKSEAWTTELLSNMRVRFDAFPHALHVLARWRSMTPETRRLICHFHVQLTDPLYRGFSGAFLSERRDAMRPEVHRQTVVQWVAEHGPGRWGLKTQIQFASRLLSCALAAGVLTGKRDPRTAITPRVPDDALAYVLHVLRTVQFKGSFVANPYLASLGIAGGHLADRFRALSSIEFRQVGDVYELEWRYPDLEAWARGELATEGVS